MTRVKTKQDFKPEIDFQIEELLLEERSTIVHCRYSGNCQRIRLWPSTFLIQEDGKRKKLLQSYNISKYPFWKAVEPGHEFTLVFEGLDKNCFHFDLLEEIPEPGGFYISNIQRNPSDVYQIKIY